jgi:hypothetical protein
MMMKLESLGSLGVRIREAKNELALVLDDDLPDATASAMLEIAEEFDMDEYEWLRPYLEF